MIDLRDAINALGMGCSDKQLGQLTSYMKGVLEWNEKVNLTRITEPDEFIVKHYLDCLVCCQFPEYGEAQSIIDVGTGAGFPGIPLAIMSPEKKLVLMDSLAKRLRIIDELCAECGIQNVTTVHARAEELARNKAHREKYDLCVSRAVANMSTLSEFCLPFIKKGGYLMAYKGQEAEVEARDAARAVKTLGGKILEIRDAKLDAYAISHSIIIVEKISPTPAKYPRKAGTPSKEPL